MTEFIRTNPTLDDCWRAIILFGRNSATFKFALAMSLLELAGSGKTFYTLEELAGPFSRNILNHLKNADRQGTSGSSRFIDTLKSYNQGTLTIDRMLDETVSRGFVNVIDAFHNVNQADVPVRFFMDERKRRNGISITDELLKMKETFQSQNLPFETEARWRLVETAWSIGISPSLLMVHSEDDNNFLFIQKNVLERINITSCRDALNGYQKGKCFYCFRDIVLNNCDVDHFFPVTLGNFSEYFQKINLNGVWNLVLTCSECNRGERGKFARIPEIQYCERLQRRNNFLIDSHHPLRETLMAQTGTSEMDRRNFLLATDTYAVKSLIHRWSPDDELEPVF